MQDQNQTSQFERLTGQTYGSFARAESAADEEASLRIGKFAVVEDFYSGVYLVLPLREAENYAENNDAEIQYETGAESHTSLDEVVKLNGYIAAPGRELVPVCKLFRAPSGDERARVEENTMAWWAMSAVGWAVLIKRYGWSPERQRNLDFSMRQMYQARWWATYERTGMYLSEILK